MLAGGMRYPEQHFNPAAARSQAKMLILAAIALVLPAAFLAATGTATERLTWLSVSISAVLLVVYLLYLGFTLITHSALFAGSEIPAEKEEPASLRKAVLLLSGATVGIAWMSEIMVGAIEPTARELGLSSVFVGVFLVAIIGNAVEHATAI